MQAKVVKPSSEARFRFGFCALLLAAAVFVVPGGVRSETAPASSNRDSSGIASVLGSGRAQSGGDDFLPPDEAFRFDAIPDGPDKVRLNWEIADGYYLYRARVKVATTSDRAQLGQLQMPAGQIKTDEYFGKQEVYHHELVATLPVARAANAPLDLPIEVTYQGCADAGLCYPPIKKTVQMTLPSGDGAGSAGAAATGSGAAGAAANGSAAVGPGASSSPDAGPSATPGSANKSASSGAGFVSEQDRYSSLVRSGNIFVMLGAFFLAGLVLAFTPCVLPMIPILSGIILGDGKNVRPGRSFALSLTYVLGMSFTYTIAGAICAAAGGQAQAVFQQPWILTLFSALFVALALSMFGVFTLQMPAVIQSRIATLSNRQSAGTFGGVAVMGVLSALIVTTCVGPALVGVLAVISQTGEIARGAAALFVMSIGMGTPLLVVGASQGKLLPKAGPWMDLVKKMVGVMMLGVSAWMLTRLATDRLALGIWAVPLLVGTYILFAFGTGPGRASASLGSWAVRAVGVAMGLYGVALVAGAALGGTDPFAPIPAFAGKHNDLPFRTIKSVADLEREVAEAKTQGRTVLVDFYADWCTSCKEMEKYTFSDSGVQNALGRTVLLRADVTKNDTDDQALLKHFGIFGPPTIAFYGLDGEERSNYRVVGYMKADAFAARAREAFQSGAKLSDGAHPADGKLAGTS